MPASFAGIRVFCYCRRLFDRSSFHLNGTMRHAFAFLVAVLLPLSTPGIAGATSLREIKERGYIVVATEDDCPPFEYAVHGGRAGYDHDLLVKFTQQTGLQVK